MCGIAGIWQLDGRRIERPTAERFIGAVAHRGPDGQGVLFEDDGRLFLGHRRLAIIGLGADGAQPMRALDGPFDITYNGEVYNFLELRAELQGHGLRFYTDTDTEVILAAFQQWGPGGLLRFNGMWSFAIWDRRRRALFLARDRFGVKPLYVSAAPGRFAFASELKAFLHLDGFEAVADMETVQARMHGNFGDGVLLRGVEMLPPGHCLEVTPAGVRRWRWWNTLDHLHAVPPSVRAQAEEFGALLADACRLRLRSDVPVATSLSGGLDSSSVLCTVARLQQRGGMARQPPEWRRAFIAGFPGTAQDETEYALLAAAEAGAVPVVQRFSAADMREHLEAYLYQFEEIGGLFGLAAWALYREMRQKGVAVSLDGHGADELLGGYDVHVVLALLRGPGLASAPRRGLELFRLLYRLHPAMAHQVLVGALMVPGLRAVVRRLRGGRAAAYPPRAYDATDAEARAVEALGPLTGALYRSFHEQSLPRILRNFDVHSMGHGVEVRMPLLDWRLVCYAFSTPDESKIGEGCTKRLLREAMRGIVPEPIRARTDKRGYNTPVPEWLDAGLADWLWDEVNDPEFVRSELWDGKALRAMSDAKRRSRARWTHDEAYRVLGAVTAHWWQTRWLRRGRAECATRPSADW